MGTKVTRSGVDTEDQLDLKRYIRDIPDFPTKGILFRDITPLLQHGPAFRYAIRSLAARHHGQDRKSVV